MCSPASGSPRVPSSTSCRRSRTALIVVLLALAAAAPAGAGAPLLHACIDGTADALCGTVVVPESRDDPASTRTIALRVTVLPATSTPARDPVFFVTGGPGGVDYDVVSDIAAGLAPVNLHHDLVFVDQRGVGGSNPLTCAIPRGGTPAGSIAGCLRDSAADVRRYRSVDAADDLEDVRVALGYGQIDLLGGSYGATLVQVFLNRHPSSVRAAVMDGATLLDVPVFERWASSAQRALELVAKRCKAERPCASTFPHWYDRFPALLTRLSRHPVSVQLGRTTVSVDAAETADTVEDMTTSAYEAAVIPTTLALAERGKLERLAIEIAARRSPPQTSLPLMPLAVECTEPWARADPAAVWADAKSTYLRYSYPEEAAAQAKLCAAWPSIDTSDENWQRPQTNVPVLDLAGSADPKDPPQNVAGLQSAMPNGRVVVVPGQGHGVLLVGCVPRLVAAFLAAGSAENLDTACAQRVRPPSFFLR